MPLQMPRIGRPRASDFEIASKEKELTMSGWTKWTFYGGFGTMVWVATSEMEKATFDLRSNILFFLLCSVVFDAVIAFIAVLEPIDTKSKSSNRFRLPSRHYPWASMIRLGYAIRFIALLIGYSYLAAAPLYFRSLCFLIFYGFFALVETAVICYMFWNYPIKSVGKQPPVRAVYKIVFYLGIFSVFAVMLGQLGNYFFAFRGGFGVADYRVGMLLAVFFWLLPVWIRYVKQYQPLLSELKTLRRDLAFQRIDVNTAIKHAEDAIEGMKVEVLQASWEAS